MHADMDKKHKGVAKKSKNGSMPQEKETKEDLDVLGVKNMNNGSSTPLSDQKSQKTKAQKSTDGKVTSFPTPKSSHIGPGSAESISLETEKHRDVKISENDEKHNDEDDKNTVASSAAAYKNTKFAVTVGTAPTFKSAERAQKRKEYYTKLEGKRKALEAEKAQAEARNKEEQQAAIRQMRKNMIFKANPVPNFYYEPPPPTVELKKLPLTRPVSPKLNRRKSCGDLVDTSQAQQVSSKHCAKHHESLGPDHNESPFATRANNLRRTQTAKAKSCSGFEQEEHQDVSETNDGPEEVNNEQPSADVSVES